MLAPALVWREPLFGGANPGDRPWEMVLGLLWDERRGFSFMHRSFLSLHSQATACDHLQGLHHSRRGSLLSCRAHFSSTYQGKPPVKKHRASGLQEGPAGSNPTWTGSGETMCLVTCSALPKCLLLVGISHSLSCWLWPQCLCEVVCLHERFK